MISPKLLIPALSGFGITAGGLMATWQLSQQKDKDKNEKESSKPSSYEVGEELANKSNGDEDVVKQRIEEECGEDIWSSGADRGRTNSKSKNFYAWRICHNNARYKYFRAVSG